MNFHELIPLLQNRFKQPLPGQDAQFEMAHLSREQIMGSKLDLSLYKNSAVLALLFPNKTMDTSLLLIERVSYNGHHSGQLALPGGKVEPSDKTLQHTALREFFEETGSDLQPHVIGNLTPIYIPISKFIVHPFVGYVNQKPNFNGNPAEVKELIEWDIDNLLFPTEIKTATIKATSEITFKAPYFDVDGRILWGATAMMLNELRRVIVPK